MPDIRNILKGLSLNDRALYAETRTTMRRAYLYAHSKVLPIDQYNEQDDAYLDLIDIKIAMLFDRAGVFNHVEGSLDTETVKAIETGIKESAATILMKQPLQQQNVWPRANGNGK